ncbi:twitching motility protein PilT [Candidatus Uabimicrobium amorphum]|uniref:Twitching motility protein PilT n=1 Tax=Uabimicrobium amorphum TaxID=2596890 RepID=A0A5S9F2C9_UABAM|nr:PilT/PilU family type 4a pilus ATPase [Candidatus Uabimicrobium amorphum]BBM82329.1 twitching motility protein PilT [Candidatus Uabimicrobium amorphum]
MRKNEIDFMLERILQSYEDISDIIFTVGRPMQVVTSGLLQPVQFEDIPIVNLTPFQTEVFSLNLVQGNSNLMHQLITTGSCDCSYQLMDYERFRVNIFSQRGQYSIVLRKLSSVIPTLQQLNLPTILQQISSEKNGLVLVTGATGSGKSSTLAAMIDEINTNQQVHVITLEDPIEFDHKHKLSTINQRELGLDFYSFPQGLRAALRQTPKVILVGEMRDRETFEIVLSAAETGHLVFSTVHTNDTGQTISRISAMFPKNDQSLIRNRLAESLRWVIGQRLVPRIQGGRIAALEILNNNARINEIIMNGETEDKTFYDVISKSPQYGMISFDQSLGSLYGQGIIAENTARTYCTRRSVITREIDRVNAEKGIVGSYRTAVSQPKPAPKTNEVKAPQHPSTQAPTAKPPSAFPKTTQKPTIPSRGIIPRPEIKKKQNPQGNSFNFKNLKMDKDE